MAERPDLIDEDAFAALMEEVCSDLEATMDRFCVELIRVGLAGPNLYAILLGDEAGLVDSQQLRNSG